MIGLLLTDRSCRWMQISTQGPQWHCIHLSLFLPCKPVPQEPPAPELTVGMRKHPETDFPHFHHLRQDLLHPTVSILSDLIRIKYRPKNSPSALQLQARAAARPSVCPASSAPEGLLGLTRGLRRVWKRSSSPLWWDKSTEHAAMPQDKQRSLSKMKTWRLLLVSYNGHS